ncbi:glycosyltransferase family 4 protein [Phocaeicola sp.]
MRILWFSPVPSLFDYKKDGPGGWVPSLEQYVRQYAPDVELAVAFEHASDRFKEVKNGTTYYPIRKIRSFWDKAKCKLKGDFDYDTLRPYILRIIEDYKPDVIHCFGSEWPWGIVAEETNIPVIIHMQGYIEVYHLAADMVISPRELGWKRFLPLMRLARHADDLRVSMESRLMKANKYFMGRTQWDYNLVKYFSPDAAYFHCPEAIRPMIYHSRKKWSYHESDSMRLVTITNGGRLKGNEIILRAAEVMKRLGFEFEWRVAGDRNGMDEAIKRSGIQPADVNVNLLGRLAAGQIIDELAVAHAYVHPAVIDNSPNSLCEAQLIGCPVVAAFVGGIPQLVEDGVTGLFYPYNEPHALAFKLMELSKDEALQKNLSVNEIVVAMDRHKPEAVVGRLMDIYDTVIKM